MPQESYVPTSKIQSRERPVERVLRKVGRYELGGDWMTICIAARCTESDSLIIVGDRLFSYGGHFVYESISLKRLPITADRRWHCMFAGKVSNVLPIIRRAREK